MQGNGSKAALLMSINSTNRASFYISASVFLSDFFQTSETRFFRLIASQGRLGRFVEDRFQIFRRSIKQVLIRGQRLLANST